MDENDYKIRSQRKREGVTVFCCCITNYPKLSNSFTISHDFSVSNLGRVKVGNSSAPCDVI